MNVYKSAVDGSLLCVCVDIGNEVLNKIVVRTGELGILVLEK